MQIEIIKMLVQRRKSTLRGEKKGKTTLIVTFRRPKEETTRIMTQ
jgi:hypothetical protein